MRVTHIIKATGLAGAERHLLDLLPGLRARGHDARLLLLGDPRRPPGEFLARARDRGVPLSSLPIRHHLDPHLWFRLGRELREVRPDIVHTHLIHGDFYGIPAARRAKVPVIVSTRHNDDAFRYRAPFVGLNRYLWSRVDLGIAVSRSMARFSREIEGAAGELRVIHHGVEIPDPDSGASARAFLGSLVSPEDGPVVGMICRLTRQKGVGDGLEAFARVVTRFPGAVLLVAGEGPDRAVLETRALNLGVASRTRFLGWRDDGRRLLAALDVLMVPSRWEGFGLVALEAMARGVPVLASRAGALSEVVAEGETGLLVTPGDIDELATGLVKLLQDESLRTRLGKAGRDRARRDFGLQRVVEATDAAYRETLQRKEAGRGADLSAS